MITAFPSLKCLLVDDNEMNRIALEHLVDLTPSLELVGSFANGMECLNFFRQGGQVDVLFLDIEMPHLSGLDLVRILPVPHPAVVIVTSHRDFAIDAYNLRVVDYLVKPVELPRFQQALQRVTEQLPVPPPEAAPGADPQHLYVKVNRKLVKVKLDDILYVEALSDYCVLVFGQQKIIVYHSLKRFTELLPPAQFIRVHRSYIININRIESIGEHTVQFAKYEVPISKTYQEVLNKQLRKI
ncbi:LytR/AlgR family response regulator transcription factor [Hymenobacter negativus]|uniref:Response regulator transcription factor n=1 Tax=Hymenobacter negativus TaxID=2795026 RepID=A0ABS3QJY2_9BACT|nr:LytTR family DNA-binding domain-containing protein [Hymenobacter negativus]MBO2011079.1 response regulator transcription factor [Hymenobacter negativus]